MIYLLTQTGVVSRDEREAVIVRATSENEARKVANSESYQEGCIWDDPLKVSCTRIHEDFNSSIILESINWG